MIGKRPCLVNIRDWWTFLIGKGPVFQIVNVLPHSQAWRTDRLQPHGPYYFLQNARLQEQVQQRHVTTTPPAME